MPDSTSKTPERTYRACGGVALDEHGRVLLIERDVERNGQPIHEVRLPKGKPEAGETDEQAALREVGEESGYWKLQIVGDLGEQSSRFVDRQNRDTLRDEHYYLMRLTNHDYAGQRMKPGSEESKFQPLWAHDLADAERQLTYDIEQSWITRARDWLTEHG